MAGGWPDDVIENAEVYEEYRQKIGPQKFDAFQAAHSWADTGKYVSHAAPAAVFLQFASDEPFVTAEMDKEYFAVGERAEADEDLQRAARAERRTRRAIVSRFSPSSFRSRRRTRKRWLRFRRWSQPPWPKDAQ